MKSHNHILHRNANVPAAPLLVDAHRVVQSKAELLGRLIVHQTFSDSGHYYLANDCCHGCRRLLQLLPLLTILAQSKPSLSYNNSDNSITSNALVRLRGLGFVMFQALHGPQQVVKHLQNQLSNTRHTTRKCHHHLSAAPSSLRNSSEVTPERRDKHQPQLELLSVPSPLIS